MKIDRRKLPRFPAPIVISAPTMRKPTKQDWKYRNTARP